MSDFKPVNQTVTPASADPGEEFPFLHTITVVDRVVSVDKPELVQNNIKTETVTLNLDSEWDGLSCIINIGNGDTPTSLIWNGQPVTIPAELMTYTGTLDVSVVGYGDDGALRAVTKKADAMFTVVASGYVEGDEPVPDPTTILGQLTEAADKANQAADRFNQASEDIGDISNAVTEVKGYADAAKASETTAVSSAATASRSETNAASSASAAKVSETNAAASATAARNAVDGFGLEVGTTTTGEPGTDAAVSIVKQGTKYVADFTIPRGEQGEPGASGLASVAHDSTLTGDGTGGNPLKVAAGTAINPVDGQWNDIDFNDYYNNGIYSFNGSPTNGPTNQWVTGVLIVSRSLQLIGQILLADPVSDRGLAYRFARTARNSGPPTQQWTNWRFLTYSDSPVNRESDIAALAARVAVLEQALETRVQALEAKLANQ